MPPVGDPVQRRQRTRKREKPAPASIFGAIHRADAPITRAQKLAGQRVQRARKPILRRTNVPYVPKLAHPTRQQRTAAIQTVGQGLKRQGVTNEDVRALSRGEGGKRKQQAVNRYLGSARTKRQRIDVGVAQARMPKGKPTAPFTFVDPLYRDAVVKPRLVPGQQAKLAKLGRSLAAQRVAQLLPGRAPAQLHLGPLTATVDPSGLRRSLLAATHLDYADPATKLVKNAIGDLGTLGTAPVLGSYQLGRGALEAATGDTSRLSQMAKGVGASVKQEFTHPGQAFSQHPILTALDAAATLTVAGRVAGAAARFGTAGRVGSTVRPPLALVDDAGTQILHERTYSKDLIRKQFQEAADARREPVKTVAGKPMTVSSRGQSVPVLRASEGQQARLLRRRGNQTAAAANSAERLAREVAGKEGRIKGIKGKRARDLVAMVVEGTVTSEKHFKDDLEAHAKRLEREHRVRTQGEPGYRHSAEEQAALNRIGTVRAALKDPKVMGQAGKIVAAGVAHGERLFKGDRGLMAREILSEESGTRSPLIVAAVEHMGGRHFTVAEHRVLEREALGRERAAAERARTATGPAKAAAVAEYHAARAERIAVSGRHPERVKAHEEAKGRVSRAEQAVRDARAEQLQADRAVARLGGAQSVQRGRTAADRMEVASRGGRRSQNVLSFIDRQLADEPRLVRGAQKERKMQRDRAAAHKRARAAKIKRQRAEKALRQERHRLRENPMPEQRAGVRTAEGKHLPNKAIEDFLRSRGRDPSTVAYLPHVLPRDMERFSRSAHHSQFAAGSRPDLDSGPSRTGEAYRKGATEASAELLKDQGVRQAVLLSKAEHLDDFVTQHGLKHPAWAKAQRGEQLSRTEQRVVDRGGAFTPNEAKELADRIATDTRTGHLVMTTKGGQQLVPIRLYSGRLDAETQRIIRENLQGPTAMETLPQRLLNDRVLREEDFTGRQTRNVVLVPKTLIDQLEKHLRPAGELERMLQMLNKPFRMAVLPQPRWLTGNFVEPYLIRLPTVGSGLVNIPGLALDIAAATKAVRRMERSGNPRLVALAKQIRAQHFGGLFIGGRGASNKRTRDEFETYGRLVAKFPAVEQMGDIGSTILKYGLMPLDAYFKINRAFIEGPAQRAAFGKQLRRDMQEFTGNWFETVRLGHEAIDEVNRGLLHTHTQERFMRMQHELLGQYEGYGPRTRALIQGPMPFLPWALSAARFVYWTMPVHHTALTALLVKTQDAMAKAWADEHADTPPGSLRLDPRNKSGGYVPFSRYTPYGLTGPIVEGDTQGLTDTVLPQLSGAVAALGGNDPFNRQLKVAPSPENPTGKAGGGQKAGIAAYGLAEALVPYLSTVRRLREHGETPYAGSTVFSPSTKPGTSHGVSAFERTFNPFRPTYLRAGGETVIPPKRAVRSRHSNNDLDLMRRAVHGPAAGSISSDDLDLIRRASRGG
jgi:hypothetical protein